MTRTSGLLRLLLSLMVAAALLTVAVAMGTLSRLEAAPERVTFPPRDAVAQRSCQPQDRPETGLQGRVPPRDLLSGRALRGYTCNLRIVGRYPASGGSSSFEIYGRCAYVGRAPGVGGVLVLDISDPTDPRPTAVLATPAMLDPWESLRVNQKRGLLVAAGDPKPVIDVYDVKRDCRHPRLLASAPILPGKGHEGWFAPDGLTYYVSTTRNAGGVALLPTLFPVDLTDPTRPRVLAGFSYRGQTHGGMTTEDGRTSYVCQQEAPPDDALLVLDTSGVGPGERNRQPEVGRQIGLDDNQWCQGAYRVTYEGHPYLIQYGERSGAPDCSRAKDGWANFGYPRLFQLRRDGSARLVSTPLLEVDLPRHCETVTGEGGLNGFGYSVHHCSPDRLYDPTILACSYFHGGMRVLDIRDPAHPVEIGYVNPGVNGPFGTAARPIVQADRGLIWFTNDVAGLYAVSFRRHLWPFRNAAPCPEFPDHYYAQYNPDSRCRTASLSRIGKPAPAAPGFTG